MPGISCHQNIVTLKHVRSRCFLAVFVLYIGLFDPLSAFSQSDNPTDVETLHDMSIEELMNIEIVTAGKTAQKLADVPASVIIVTRDEIQKQGYHTLEEVITNIPGFYGINDYGEGGMMFGIRGFWSGVPNDKIIILINNVPQTKNVFTSHPLSEIPVPVEAIERVEVVRGPMSIIYGSGAFYGAVNIITEAIDPKENPHLVSFSSGSAQTNKVFLRISETGENFELSANVSVYQTDGIDQPASALMSDPSELTKFDISPSYTTAGSMKKDHKYFDLSARLNDFDIHLVLVEIDEGGQFSFPAYGDGHEEMYSDFNLSIGYRKMINESLSLNNKLTYYKDRVWFNYHFFNDDFYGIQQLESKAVEFTTDAFYSPSSSLKVQTGFFLKSIYDVYNMYDVPSFGDPYFDNNYIKLGDDAIKSTAVYTQFDYVGFKNIHLLAGFRLEKSFKYTITGGYSYDTDLFDRINREVDRANIEFLPRLSLIYKLNDRNVLKLLYGKANKQPSFFQDHIQTQASNNPLLPENIETLEFNYQATAKSAYSFNLNLFHNTLDNMITRVIVLDEGGNYESSENKNAGRLVTNGMEITFNYSPSSKFSTELSTTIQATTDQLESHKNIELAYSPKLLAYLKVHYDLTKQISLALNANYVDEMETYWDDSPDEASATYVPLGRIGKSVDGYFLTGLNLRIHDLIIPGGFGQLRISNLLDGEVRYPAFTNNAWADRGTLGHGRTLYLTVGKHF